MIVFVGNRLKLGSLIEAAKTRTNEEVVCVDENPNIIKQENDILEKADGASFIVYDTECYLNDADQIVSIIRRIYRANKAKPILLVPTSNPNNEIIKTAAECQFKLVINTSLSAGEQKDQFEKAILGFYEGNENSTVTAALEIVEGENNEIKEFVTGLYDAKQREEERETTVIIKKKGTTEVLINAVVKLIKTIITIIIFILAAIGLATLIYPGIRAPFIKELLHVIAVLKNALY